MSTSCSASYDHKSYNRNFLVFVIIASRTSMLVWYYWLLNALQIIELLLIQI